MEAIEYWRPISRSTLLEPKGWQVWNQCVAVAITFKMDAKKNDGNEHKQKKSPLTSIPLFSRPHFLLFSQSFLNGLAHSILRQHSLRSILQISAAVSILCDFYHLESKAMATSHTSQSLHVM